MRRTRRAGFTALELLVAVAIIALVMALALPAVQRARESGRRTQCAANLRQIMLAVEQSTNIQRRYPVSTFNALPHTAQYAADRGWLVSLLPFLEQRELAKQAAAGPTAFDDANRAAFNTFVPTFSCPSSAIVRLQGIPARFGGIDAANRFTHATDYYGNTGVLDLDVPPERRFGPIRCYIPGLTIPATAAAVRAGSDRAIAVWESAGDQMWVNPADGASWGVDWSTYFALTYNTLPFNPGLVQGQPTPTAGTALAYYRGWPGTAIAYLVAFGKDGESWGSWSTHPDQYNRGVNASNRAGGPYSHHPGGLNVAFLDGHVEFIGEEIEFGVLQDLCRLSRP